RERHEVAVVEVRVLRMVETGAGRASDLLAVRPLDHLRRLALAGHEPALATRREPGEPKLQYTVPVVANDAREPEAPKRTGVHRLVDVAGVAGRDRERERESERRRGYGRDPVDVEVGRRHGPEAREHRTRRRASGGRPGWRRHDPRL